MRRAVAREKPVACAACDKRHGRAAACRTSRARARPLASVAMNSLSCCFSGDVCCAIAPACPSSRRPRRRRLTGIRRSVTIIHSANLRSIIEHNTLHGMVQAEGRSGVNANGTARSRAAVPIGQGGRNGEDIRRLFASTGAASLKRRRQPARRWRRVRYSRRRRTPPRPSSSAMSARRPDRSPPLPRRTNSSSPTSKTR